MALPSSPEAGGADKEGTGVLSVSVHEPWNVFAPTLCMSSALRGRPDVMHAARSSCLRRPTPGSSLAIRGEDDVARGLPPRVRRDSRWAYWSRRRPPGDLVGQRDARARDAVVVGGRQPWRLSHAGTARGASKRMPSAANGPWTVEMALMNAERAWWRRAADREGGGGSAARRPQSVEQVQ